MAEEVKTIGTFVVIKIGPVDTMILYSVVEPVLTNEEKKIVEEVKREIMYREDDVPLDVLKNGFMKNDYIGDLARKIIEKRWKVDSSSVDKLVYYVVRDLAGYGKIDALMKDDDIEDISCSGSGLPVYVFHKRFGYIPTNIEFDEEELTRFIYKLSGMIRRQISVSQPIVEGILPDGSRVNCSLPVVSTKGGTFTIRKYTFKPLSIIELIQYGTLNIDLAAYLWMLMDYKKSILISGEVGAGKTTLMNAILGLIFRDKKVITIEETPEIRLDGFRNWSQKVTRESYRMGVVNVDLFELVKSALRERPDYIIVGEVRGREAYTLFQAISLGHGGIATIHAGSPEKAIKRLTSNPMNIPMDQIPLLSCMIHMVKIRDKIGFKRRVSRVCEVVEEGDRVVLKDIFKYNYNEDRLEVVGRSSIKEELSLGIDFEKEFNRRRMVLEYAFRNNLTGWDDVVHLVAEYNLSPENVYGKALVFGVEIESKEI